MNTGWTGYYGKLDGELQSIRRGLYWNTEFWPQRITRIFQFSTAELFSFEKRKEKLSRTAKNEVPRDFSDNFNTDVHDVRNCG